MALPGLPLSPGFEAGRRNLSDVLDQILAQLNSQRGQITAQGDLTRARLATDEDFALRGVDENAIERGLYDSGIRETNRAQTGLGFERQRQDLGSALARQFGDLGSREAEARGDYSRGLTELLLEQAREGAMNQSLGSYGGLSAPGRRRRPTPPRRSARRPTPAPVLGRLPQPFVPNPKFSGLRATTAGGSRRFAY